MATTEKFVISYAYAHAHSSAGKRLKILNSRHLLNNGWQVITSQISSTAEPNVIQIPVWTDRAIQPIAYGNTSRKRNFKKLAMRILWPDRGIFWALKAAFLLWPRFYASPVPRKIVTVSYPFSSHLIGLFLKLCFSKRVTWVAHYIDGFYLVNKGNDAPRFLAPLSFIAEKAVNAWADKIIINRSKSQDFAKIFGRYERKKQDIDELPGIEISIDPDFPISKGTALFAGSLYRKIRNPDKVFEIFRKLPKYRLRVAGNLNDCIDLMEKSTAEYIGLLTPDEIQRELKSAEFLVNIDNQDNAQQPPGKIIEYMQLQKPILNFYMKTSISGETLRRHQVSKNAFLELNLNDSNEVNIQKLIALQVPQEKLFEVPDGYSKLSELYNDCSV